MKLFAILSATGAFLLLPQSVIAVPVIEARGTATRTTTSDASAIDSINTNSSNGNGSDADSESSGKTPATVEVEASYGQPRCKSPGLLELCTADNANAYCDRNGFHCNFMKSCKGCWCE